MVTTTQYRFTAYMWVIFILVLLSKTCRMFSNLLAYLSSFNCRKRKVDVAEAMDLYSMSLYCFKYL